MKLINHKSTQTVCTENEREREKEKKQRERKSVHIYTQVCLFRPRRLPMRQVTTEVPGHRCVKGCPCDENGLNLCPLSVFIVELGIYILVKRIKPIQTVNNPTPIPTLFIV